MQFAAIPPCIIHCYKITKNEVKHGTGAEREGGKVWDRRGVKVGAFTL